MDRGIDLHAHASSLPHMRLMTSDRAEARTYRVDGILIVGYTHMRVRDLFRGIDVLCEADRPLTHCCQYAELVGKWAGASRLK